MLGADLQCLQAPYRLSNPILVVAGLNSLISVRVAIFRIGANLWRCLGATAIAYYHSSRDDDGTDLDDEVRSEVSRLTSDLLVLADLLRRVDSKRFEVRRLGKDIVVLRGSIPLTDVCR